MARSLRDPEADAAPPAPVGPISQRIGAAPAAEPAPEAPPADAGASVPDVPKLADGVHLSGDMEESAFVEPQWLVQRDGQFVQLTELLYRVAEQIDGQKDLAEIAEAVGEKIDRDVTDDNVRQLIGEKLIPLGLVEDASGQAVRPANAGRSLLQVNARMAMVPEQVSQALGRAFSFLYWPPVLIVALAAAIAAQGWLYVTHGIGGSVHDVLYRPQLLLVVMAVIVVATGFHELGHAAGLVYGGGKVRGMGAGFYLIYPAFYTDVTDNYRLGRWARVRTDLGGIYFNLIFAAGIVALYLVTQWEFLLVSVILLNIQTVQQLLPFVRLDGYWLLADITGIPDFFTHMGGFVRSVLPIKAWRGPKLPELKWWGKAVFAGYILLVIPLLGFILFLAVKSFPRVAATTWDSFQQQLGQLSAASVAGDMLGVLGTAAGIVLLALPAVGLAYMFWLLGKGLFLRLWSWSGGDVRKRVLAMASLGAAALVLGVLWTPRIPVVGQPGPLYAASGEWKPIAPDERGTVADVVAGQVVYTPLLESRPEFALARATEIALGEMPSPSPTPFATATPLDAIALGTATPAVEPTLTVPATPVESAAARTPTAFPMATENPALLASPTIAEATPTTTRAEPTATVQPTRPAPSPTSVPTAPPPAIAAAPTATAPAPTATPMPTSPPASAPAPPPATSTPTVAATTSATTTPGPGTPRATVTPTR